MSKRVKTFSIKAQGDSMYPILQNGDTIEYIQTPFHKIQLNDIVLVYDNTILVTHRVIYKTKNNCITRGDNNRSADSPIQKGRVLGKVLRFQRGRRWYGVQEAYLAQSTLYLHEIQKLETLLSLYKIPHVFFKGVLISLRYENTIPKRIYADCDVLVERAYISQITKNLIKLGYQPQKQWAVSDSIIPEVNFIKNINGIPIIFDIHFEPHFLSGILGEAVNMLYSFSTREKLTLQIVRTNQKKFIHSHPYLLPNPAMQIVVLALHIFHHNFTNSTRYHLLDVVIRKSLTKKLWTELTVIIKEYKLEGYIYLVFILLKKYFYTSIPASFFLSIRPSGFKLFVLSSIEKYIDIFSQDNRTKAGVNRFILIFLLSPNHLLKKLLIIIHPSVLFTAFSLFIHALMGEKK